MITGRVYEVGDEVRVDIEVDGVRYEGRHGFSGGGRGKESLVRALRQVGCRVMGDLVSGNDRVEEMILFRKYFCSDEL